MSVFSSAYKTIHGSSSSSPREHPSDSAGVILSHGGCSTYDQGQMTGAELSLMEMTEVEYTHLQHLIQAQMEGQATPPDVRSHPAVLANDALMMSPFPSNQAIDLSTSTEEHCVVMPGESTPTSYGEVPGFVLARIRGENGPTESPPNSSTSAQMRSRSAARVCLEKRFNTMCADTPRQQSVVLSNFLTMFQPSAEAQEKVVHPQLHKWMKTDRANSFEGTSPYVEGVYNPVRMCGQVIGHIPRMVEPNKHQSLIIPKNFAFNFRPEMVITKPHFTSSSTVTGEQQMVHTESDLPTLADNREHGNSSQPMKAEDSGSSSRKRGRSRLSLSQRREKHNSKERERRKKIRLCCDELNMLVPFCDADTDKVTTLQWTITFLRYIKKTYGDTFKEEFQSAFTAKKGPFPNPKTHAGQDPFQRDTDETLSIPLAVEQ